MSGPGPNASGAPGPNAGTTTSETATGSTSATPLLPYIAGLSLPDFNQLINDPIRHDVGWLAMPTKLPSNIPKFDLLSTMGAIDPADDQLTVFDTHQSEHPSLPASVAFQI